ncbi:uncharacterized protein involved in response to NO [Bradyrhizobium sp. F1.4.3]
MLAAGLVKILPETGAAPFLLGAHYALSASLWSLAFLTWLIGFFPLLRHPLRESNSGGPYAGHDAIAAPT